MVAGDYVGLSAFTSSVQAQETDDVAVIDMSELPTRGCVDPDFVNLRGVVPKIFDMSENVTFCRGSRSSARF